MTIEDAEQEFRTDKEENRSMGMQLDREALGRLLSMNDEQLSIIIHRMAAENGLDLTGFNITAKDMASVRQALSSATDEELQQVAEQVKAGRKRRGNGKNG